MADDNSPSSSSSTPSDDVADNTRILIRCEFCIECFDGRQEYSAHLAGCHDDHRLYKCTKCSFTFTTKRELTVHGRVHKGDPVFSCAKCCQEFATVGQLKKHELSHAGVRPHVCTICSQAFFQKGHLTQHYKIHEGTREYVCEFCHKDFVFKFDLNRHAKVHEERDMFKCETCGKSYFKQESLDVHKCRGEQSTDSATACNLVSGAPLLLNLPPLPIIANIHPFTCMFCGMVNESMADLAQHLATIHFQAGRSTQYPIPMALDAPLSLPDSSHGDAPPIRVKVEEIDAGEDSSTELGDALSTTIAGTSSIPFSLAPPQLALPAPASVADDKLCAICGLITESPADLTIHLAVQHSHFGPALKLPASTPMDINALLTPTLKIEKVDEIDVINEKPASSSKKSSLVAMRTVVEAPTDYRTPMIFPTPGGSNEVGQMVVGGASGQQLIPTNALLPFPMMPPSLLPFPWLLPPLVPSLTPFPLPLALPSPILTPFSLLGNQQ